MKHEIEITDELVWRAHNELSAPRWINKWGTFEAMKSALEAALNPQRRWADSQREERRCGEKHIEGNQVVAGVEAPHGAEESIKPSGVWSYCPPCPGPEANRFSHRRKDDGEIVFCNVNGCRWVKHGDHFHTRKTDEPLDATRRPPNPTSDIHVSGGDDY